MQYIYTLTDKDLLELEIEKRENAKEYFAIQDGWFGWFKGIFYTIEIDGFDYDLEIEEDFGEIEESYIIKNCKCKEI